MTILGIETSCDETSVALVEGRNDVVLVKSNAVASSLALHAKTGGVIPEVAARAQLKYMLPVLSEAIEKAFGDSVDLSIKPPPIDAIAVTYGPGLIGPLLVGVETARTLSYVWDKPIIPVNHMMGHIYANFVRTISDFRFPISNEKTSVPEFPLLALVVSGGHTDLVFMNKHGDYQVIGGTRDDAAGEAFDKIGRLLGLPYPAGPLIERRSRKGGLNKFIFPRPLLGARNYDFSFSGLKAAAFRTIKKIDTLDSQTVDDICASIQASIIEILLKKTLRAAEEYNVRSILLSGGVAANQTLREAFQSEILKRKIRANFFVPAKNLCTDNAAMIAAAGYFLRQPIAWRELTVNPELYYE
jgi:N6-L-threonylcarbamoyladenine synthase